VTSGAGSKEGADAAARRAVDRLLHTALEPAIE
jgi:hypothetical protein